MTSRSYIYVLNTSKNILSEMLEILEIHQTVPPNNNMESGNTRWFCKKIKKKALNPLVQDLLVFST